MRLISTLVSAVVLLTAIAIFASRLAAAPDKPASNDSKRERAVYRRANA
jgi:hypothetical protein